MKNSYLFTGYALFIILSACATIQIPEDLKGQDSFIQKTNIDYKTTYRIITKQMTACNRVIGFFGNGYDVYNEIDTSKNHAVVELFPISLGGASKPEESMFSRKVTIEKADSGSLITTSGTTPKYTYMTHSQITNWIEGNTTCSPKK